MTEGAISSISHDRANGPVAVVTGGTGGIGSAICIALAEAGFRVGVGYHRSEAAAARMATELSGGSHFALATSVTEGDCLAVAAQRVAEELGRCDALVNCAGMTRFIPHGDLEALDDALFDEIMSTNTRGAFAATRAFLPLLAASPLEGGGVVVNISSIAAVTAMGSNIAYCASKAALDNMTKSLARALAPKVRVVSVSPGLVDTDFIRSLDQNWRDEQVHRTPLGELARPNHVAAAVISVIDNLTFTTGSILAVDGGRALG